MSQFLDAHSAQLITNIYHLVDPLYLKAVLRLYNLGEESHDQLDERTSSLFTLDIWGISITKNKNNTFLVMSLNFIFYSR